MSQPLILVAGPTASGKSALAIRLAKEFKAEVVNMDSVQLYKELAIGSARLLDKEMQDIPHHLLGILSPSESFDVARYVALAESVIAELESRKALPLFVGGTSLYISSLLYGLADLPPGNPMMRQALEELSTEDLYKKLCEHDEVSSRTIHIHDRGRIIRAIEASSMLGEPVSSHRVAHGQKTLQHNSIIVVPMWTRDVLYDRIQKRSYQMLEDGLVDEVSRISQKYGEATPALQTIGYNEVAQYLKGKISLAELPLEIAQNTKRFAKRQMTWLRNEPLKRGWRVRPSSEDPQDRLEGDTTRFSKPHRLKHFSTMNVDFEGLVRTLKTSLNQDFKGVEVWFVNGSKVI